jgi:hypothetical protein
MDEMRKDTDVAEHQEWFEVIAAFVDGERVDTEALGAALVDEAGREFLIDLVAMREMVRTTDGQAPSRPARHWSKAMAGVAAVLAVVVGVAGYAIGQHRGQVVHVAVLPPLEADVIVAVETPPPPTHVIRLDSSVPGIGGR